MGAHMSQPPVKEGFVERFKSGLFSSKWRSAYARLYPDSTLALYNDRGDSRPVETIFIKNVVPYICVGFMTDRMPTKRPELPPGTEVQRLVGIGMDPQASKVHWILFPSVQILEEWLGAIMSTLPKPPNQPNPPPVPNSDAPRQEGFVPPVKYPDAPPPYGQSTGAGQPAPPQPGYYGPQQPAGPPGQAQYPSQQILVVDRTAGGGGGYGGSSGLGTGLAAGMGGAMLGGLMGYGIGSMFAPHGGWGHGGYGGYGGGYGGGYQDNDTFVTNNYYINNDDTNNTPVQNTDTTPAVTDQDYSTPGENDYGGGDYDGGGGGFDDYGGGDFGGGDFDGGGGDW